jgi:hypothetical protein
LTLTYETNKNRDVYKHTVTLPNGWITEDNVLCLIPDSEYTSVPRLVEMANKQLREYEFPEPLNSKTILPLLVKARRWVHPDYLALEFWPPNAVTKERTAGWVMIYLIDLEKML